MNRNVLYWSRKLITDWGGIYQQNIFSLNEKDSQVPGGFQLANHDQNIDISGMGCKDKHQFGEVANGIA